MNFSEFLNTPYFSAIVIVFGLVIGSFLNVVIQRLPQNQSMVTPRSRCPKCSKPIRWFHNIPVLGFLMLRGKCADCGEKISWRYPFVELATAFLFYFSFRHHLDIAQLRIWVFIALGIAITFIDFDHQIIPDELSIGGMVFGLLTAYWDLRHGFVHLLLASLGGVAVFLLFAMAYEKLTGREGFGGGDIKFMGTVGAFLGLGGIWSTAAIGSVVGSIVGIAAAKIKKNEEVMKTVIPFGPFMVLGGFLELFFEVSKWAIRR